MFIEMRLLHLLSPVRAACVETLLQNAMKNHQIDTYDRVYKSLLQLIPPHELQVLMPEPISP